MKIGLSDSNGCHVGRVTNGQWKIFRLRYAEKLRAVSSAGRMTKRERKRKRQPEDVEVQRRRIPRSTKWPILSSSLTVLFQVFATLAGLDQQNFVCPVTLAHRIKARIDLKASFVSSFEYRKQNHIFSFASPRDAPLNRYACKTFSLLLH